MKGLRTEAVIQAIENGEYDERFSEIYMDATRSVRQKERYIRAVKEYVGQFGAGEVAIFSAPGRSEIGGNHTDHQHGEVRAAAINRDAIAIVGKTEEACVKIISEGYELIKIDLDETKHAKYFEQAANGVPTREAIFSIALGLIETLKYERLEKDIRKSTDIICSNEKCITKFEKTENKYVNQN